jgi:hypothetical protein
VSSSRNGLKPVVSPLFVGPDGEGGIESHDVYLAIDQETSLLVNIPLDGKDASYSFRSPTLCQSGRIPTRTISQKMGGDDGYVMSRLNELARQLEETRAELARIRIRMGHNTK